MYFAQKREREKKVKRRGREREDKNVI